MVSKLVNLVEARGGVALVERGGNVTTSTAYHTCYVREAELSAEAMRLLRAAKGVRAVTPEPGGWQRVEWRDYELRRAGCEWLQHLGYRSYEGDLNPVRRYLVDHSPTFVPPRPCFLDIETDSRVPFGHKEQARVLCWALVDGPTRRTKTDCLEEDSDEGERRLLTRLWAALKAHDQILAWNGDRFDKPVLIARSERLQVQSGWQRWLWLDHLALFRRLHVMAAKSGDEKQSFALDVIAQALLGRGKHSFDSSKTWEAWEAGGERRQELVDYCLQDTRLMPDIEDVTGYIELFRTVCEVCGIPPDSKSLNPQYQVEALLLRLSKQRGTKPVTRPIKSRTQREQEEQQGRHQFNGAYVMQPKASGIVQGVHVADFASMYPSIICSFNMSPEMKRDRLPDGSVPKDCAVAPGTGQCFYQPDLGMLPEAVNEILGMRKHWTALMNAAVKNTPEWHEASRRSKAYKICANIFFGGVGAPTCLFYDERVAESITSAGVYLIKQTIKAVEDRGWQAIYADTDSILVVGCNGAEFAEFVGWCNVKLYPELLTKLGCVRNIVKISEQDPFERITFVAAKKYAGVLYAEKGGALEVKGLEYMRGDSVKLARTLQAQAVEQIMRHDLPSMQADPVAVFEPIIRDMRDRVLKSPLVLDEVKSSKSLRKSLAEYKAGTKQDGTAAAQPPHVMVALELKKRGRDVGEGTKVNFVCVDGASAPKRFIPAEDFTGELDRHYLWEDQVWPPTERLLAAAFPGVNWESWGRTRPAKPKVSAGQRKAARLAAGTLGLFDRVLSKPGDPPP